MKLIGIVRNKIPRFSYCLYDKNNPTGEGHEKWNHPLPMNRKHLPSPDDFSFTFGTYFHALASFLEQDDFLGLRTGLSHMSGRMFSSAEIGEIPICLEKHGEFYHPARVEIGIKGVSYSFVINGAVSDAGRESIGREYALLKNMQDRFPFPFLPRVWTLGEGNRIPMFLGQWFEGFHEFHIAASSPVSPSMTPGGKQQISVWDPEGHFYLNPEQKADLYRQIAMILTACYDIETFMYISPWHHAAGDFVLKADDTGRLQVKLITLRQYRPIVNIHPEEADESDLIHALLLFLLHLTLHTRLDRVEGTGAAVWAEDDAIRPTLEGFFLGLRQKEAPWSDTLPHFFLQYLCRIPEDRMEDSAQAIADTWPQTSPEHKIIRENLKKHVKKLFQTVNEGIDL